MNVLPVNPQPMDMKLGIALAVLALIIFFAVPVIIKKFRRRGDRKLLYEVMEEKHFYLTAGEGKSGS